LGDTGVGLSIAKTLAEAQGGRIWVDTEMGIGSTFSILLPVLLETEEEK
jgi:two-component system sensor histidine kinase ChiS